jgi:uncharacterized protein DUF5825
MLHQEAGCQVISLWADYDDASVELSPRMSLGSVQLGEDPRVNAEALFARGVRRVTFDGVIDLSQPGAADTVRALTLIRDLTSYGIVVGWQLRAEWRSGNWQELSHLYPPTRIIQASPGSAADLSLDWRRGYHLAKCVTRRGPGLLQVKDRRWGALRRVTITKSEYMDAIALLQGGVLASNVPSHVYADLSAAHLIGQVGELVWWLPYQVRRWPSSGIWI